MLEVTPEEPLGDVGLLDVVGVVGDEEVEPEEGESAGFLTQEFPPSLETSVPSAPSLAPEGAASEFDVTPPVFEEGVPPGLDPVIPANCPICWAVSP